ncbi:MAG: hypothetical protein OJF51_004762 [Nitrospira sp.]|nr:MAG: hypothetical protein OJF51_004762 [Nitrospira sp.]
MALIVRKFRQVIHALPKGERGGLTDTDHLCTSYAQLFTNRLIAQAEGLGVVDS